MRWGTSWGDWPEYVPVAKRIATAKRRAAKQAARVGRKPEPVQVSGREIAKTFWGKSWCRNLECFSDFASRLPRGRTYVRNGSVVDLVVTRSRIEAIVAGSMVYDVAVAIAPLSPVKWRAIKADCATSIGSLIDLLAGRLSNDVMQRLVKPGEGMFPAPREINVKCSCPDGANICKHLAAVFYAIGHRLDTRPELLFLLRGVDQTELVAAATKESVSRAVRGDAAHALADADLSTIFGIDLGSAAAPAPRKSAPVRKSPAKAAVKKTKRAAKRKPVPSEKSAVKKTARRRKQR
ncbi:MAG: SWIM zinc finger family protein [Planctomycetia bacterium]|nr:SWIM zinc finger family protein [Planctomycetia bacterium]